MPTLPGREAIMAASFHAYLAAPYDCLIMPNANVVRSRSSRDLLLLLDRYIAAETHET
jgi:hypothetical protein